jgi:hypothetical protein
MYLIEKKISPRKLKDHRIKSLSSQRDGGREGDPNNVYTCK